MKFTFMLFVAWLALAAPSGQAVSPVGSGDVEKVAAGARSAADASSAGVRTNETSPERADWVMIVAGLLAAGAIARRRMSL